MIVLSSGKDGAWQRSVRRGRRRNLPQASARGTGEVEETSLVALAQLRACTVGTVITYTFYFIRDLICLSENTIRRPAKTVVPLVLNVE